MVEIDGLKFVADTRFERYLAGLEIETREYYGREGIVAYNRSLGGGCY